MPYNWKYIDGPVWLRNRERLIAHANLDAFFTAYNRFFISVLIYERLTDEPVKIDPWIGFRLQELGLPPLAPSWSDGYKYNLLDEIGLIIPRWKLIELARARGITPPERIVFWRPHAYKPERDFRNGPVAYTRRSRWHRFHQIRTSQEHRENSFLNFDEDVLEFGVKRRPARCSGLPTTFDDEGYRDTQRNWKKQRRTQWKTA